MDSIIGGGNIVVVYDPDKEFKVNSINLGLYSKKIELGRVVLSGDLLEKIFQFKVSSQDVFFTSWDDGDVYSMFKEKASINTFPGTIWFCEKKTVPLPSSFGKLDDHVRVVVRRGTNMGEFKGKGSSSLRATGFLRYLKEWKEVPTEILPVRTQLFSRFGGLIETDVLADKKVFIVGLGSGGSFIALEVAKSGVMYFVLMDHDRLEVGNVMRHMAYLQQVGRYKTKVMAQLIKAKNPYANVQTFEEKATWDNADMIREIVRESDLVICATDNRMSKLLINRVCVEEKTTCFFAGASRRAYGGQVQRVRPFESSCYQCFCMHLPEKAADVEISNREQAANLAYTYGPGPIEPGLSSDIAPISLMVVKLVIQELLKGTDTTLSSLNEDLTASFYLWLNRREVGTQYEKLKPLAFEVGGFHVLRWYGIDIPRHPGCPVCGEYLTYIAQQWGIEPTCNDYPSKDEL